MKYTFNSSQVKKINETCHGMTAGAKFPRKQVNKSVSPSIAPIFILPRSPEWHEAGDGDRMMRRERNLRPSLPFQGVRNEHVSSPTHFISFNWSVHPSCKDPISGAFNLSGPLIMYGSRMLELHVRFSSKYREREGRLCKLSCPY